MMWPNSTICVSNEVLQWMDFEVVRSQYQTLLWRLHGESLWVSPVFFRELLNSNDDVISFVISENQLVAMAQASRVKVLPAFQAVVNNVAVREGFDGKGFGRQAMTALESMIKFRWSCWMTGIVIFFTNSPLKNNAGFYKSLGYKARGEMSEKPTIVWVKHIF